MLPDDFEAMNNILIAQAGDMEILIQGQQERIRDLEAEVERLKAKIERLTEPYVERVEKSKVYKSEPEPPKRPRWGSLPPPQLPSDEGLLNPLSDWPWHDDDEL